MDSYSQIRQDFFSFWSKRGHTLVPPASLTPRDDATTLFTSSGMQQLVPYLSGEQTHPLGQNLYNIQPCLRVGDIDEVGDNRHTTFFEMLGNWSLGDYFKKEQIPAMWELYTEIFGLDPDNLHVTVFEGNDMVPKDTESYDTWKDLGLSDDHIHWYGVEKNWWSRSGIPAKMPEGEIGGPDTELFYEFKKIDHDPIFGPTCHPNCDCGRFLEIGNSVFIQYKKSPDGSLLELSQKSVDFGGGLERILAAQRDDPDIFHSVLFERPSEIIRGIVPQIAENDMRILLDHMRACLFLINDGVIPSNKEQGYVLRKLLRRALISIRKYDDRALDFTSLIEAFASTYQRDYKIDILTIKAVLLAEMDRFYKLLTQTSTLLNQKDLSAKILFDMYQSHGIPFEISLEEAKRQGMAVPIDIESEFKLLVEKHSISAKTASEGKFKGGLADSSNQVVKYHTATHLIHQALHDLLGDSVRQEGSNITQARLRFDFQSDVAPMTDLATQLQRIVQEKIDAALPVTSQAMSKDQAINLGARAFFREKYPDVVTVYAIGGSPDDLSGAYSIELCGGPHVTNTSEIGTIFVDKVQKIGASTYRLYAHSNDTKEISEKQHAS